MFRLLAFDLDGTLLERDGSLSEESVAGLKRLAVQGVELVAATGRRLWSALPHLERAGLEGACVVHNGALVVDVARRERLAIQALAPATVRRLVGALLDRGLTPLVFTAAPKGPGEVLAQAGAPDATKYCAWYFRYAAGHFTQLDDLRSAAFEDALRVVVHGPLEVLVEIVRAFEADFGADVRGFVQRETTVDTFRAEFLSKRASKWSGIVTVASRLGVEPSQIVAVGDEANDLEMLAGAGHSFAAPGASDVARRHAREALEGDGPRAVVRALERIFAIP
jgi:hydroxymethylpyrimidine pyrophosphatase-like HAD family hydrolase